jgi:hypothetical protein
MAFVVLVSAIAVLGLGAGIALLCRYLIVRNRLLPISIDWIYELSPERYAPMFRLLDERDMVFLRSQPGFSPRMEARLREQRWLVFNAYLRCLRADFNRACMALKLLIAQADRERPDLVRLLLRSQLRFTWGMALIRCRLVLYRLGIGRMDLSRVMNTFNGLCLELRTRIPAVPAFADVEPF